MAKWRNKINIKELLTEDESNEQVLKVADNIALQLKRILNNENKIFKRQQEQGKETTLDEMFLWDIEEVISDFEFVKTGIENDLNPSEFSFKSWCEALNEYLNKLYDLGDTLITRRDFFNDEKFLWVG